MKKLTALLLLIVLLFGCAAPAEHTSAPPAKKEITVDRGTMQQAIVQTAFAYYYQDPEVQYDSGVMVQNVNAMRRINTTLTPEEAGEDNLIYSVCSNFCHRVCRETFGIDLMGLNNWRFITKTITEIPADDPLVVYKYGGTDGDTDHEGMPQKILNVIEPGDLLVYYRTVNSGHAVLCVGDAFGEGKPAFLECGGGSMDRETGEDPLERKGAILRGLVENTVFNERWQERCARAVVLRPVNLEGLTLTDAAISRLRFPNMRVRKSFSQPYTLDVADGESITVTIEVTNHSEEDYVNLPVEDPTPADQTVTQIVGNGKNQDGTIRWLLNVPAGETVTVGYTTELHGAYGERVTFPRGRIDDSIQTRTATFRFGGTHVSDALRPALRDYGRHCGELTADHPNATEFVNRFYRKMFGVDPAFPATAEELFEGISEIYHYESLNMRRYRKGESETARRLDTMLIERHFCGRSVIPESFKEEDDGESSDITERAMTFRDGNYRPGDVFFTVKGPIGHPKEENVTAQLILDNDHVLVYAGGKAEVVHFCYSVETDMLCTAVAAFRPSQAGLFDAE